MGWSDARPALRVTPIKYLQQWDVFTTYFLAVHCVNVDRRRHPHPARHGRRRAHRPKSNAKLGCGIAPLTDLLHEGVRVGIGTDSPASSNIMDMFDEMRTMLFRTGPSKRDVSVLDAQKCVRIATLGGAEALGMEAEVGAGTGKRADLIAVDVSRSHFAPIADPRLVLVYGVDQDDIRLTVIGRRELYRDRVHVGVDVDAVRSLVPSPCREKLTRTACAPASSRSAALSPAVARTPAHRERPSKVPPIARRSSSAEDRLRVHGVSHGGVPRRGQSGVPDGCTWVHSGRVRDRRTSTSRSPSTRQP